MESETIVEDTKLEIFVEIGRSEWIVKSETIVEYGES